MVSLSINKYTHLEIPDKINKYNLNDALESVVIALVGSSELQASIAEWFDDISTLLVLYLCTLLPAGGHTFGVSGSPAPSVVPSDGDFIQHGYVVENSVAVFAGPDGNFHALESVDQGAFFPCFLNTVFIAGPDPLAGRVHHPLGVALLPGHVLALGLLVVLIQGLGAGLVAVLAVEGQFFNAIVMHSFGKGIRGTLCVSNNLAFLLRDGNTRSVHLLVADTGGSVGAQVGHRDVVLDFTVPGYVDTSVVVAVPVVMAAAVRKSCD